MLFGVLSAIGSDPTIKNATVAAIGSLLSSAIILLFRYWWDKGQLFSRRASAFDQRTKRFTATTVISSFFIASCLVLLEFFNRGELNFTDLGWASTVALALASSHLVVTIILRPILGNFTTLLWGKRLSEYFLLPYEGSANLSKDGNEPPVGQKSFNISDESAAVVAELQSRCDRLGFTNTMILFFVVLVIGASAVFIVFAGSIATKDTQSLDRIATARKSIDGLEESIQGIEIERESLQAKIATEKQRAENQKLPDDIRIIARSRVFEAEAKLLSVNSRLERRLKEYQRSRELLAKQEEASIVSATEAVNSTSATNLLLAAGITRFGILALVIYLVQILINLYRYNAEISNRYQSQIDSLLLVNEDAAALSAILKVLQIDVHFGRQPMHLSQRLFEQFSQLIKPRAGSGASEIDAKAP